MTEVQAPEFKILLVGDQCIGKETLVKTLFPQGLAWPIEKRCIHAVSGLRVDVHRLCSKTNRGYIILNVWVLHFHRFETVGLFTEFLDEVYHGAQGAILMFDVTSRCTYKKIPLFYRDLQRGCGNALPMYLCGNQVDVRDRKVKARQITFHRKTGLEYCDISAKTMFHVERPFLWMVRKLSDDKLAVEKCFGGDISWMLTNDDDHLAAAEKLLELLARKDLPDSWKFEMIKGNPGVFQKFGDYKVKTA